MIEVAIQKNISLTKYTYYLCIYTYYLFLISFFNLISSNKFETMLIMLQIIEFLKTELYKEDVLHCSTLFLLHSITV